MIAAIAHEANRAHCRGLGDHSQDSWENAPDWHRRNVIKGVENIRLGAIRNPQDSHAGWMEQKMAAGWKNGPERDPELMTHPCLVPFEELPREQQVKNYLFFAIASTLVEWDQETQSAVASAG